MSEKSGKLIAVWGAPHSGKTTFAAALGTAIADTYAAATVIVLHSDIEAPMLSVLFPNAKSGSLGSVGIPLSANELDTEQILANCTETKARPTLAVMGYRDGDTRLTYPRYGKERAVELFEKLKSLADFVIVDCMSNPNESLLSLAALETASQTVRLCTPELPSISWYRTQKSVWGTSLPWADMNQGLNLTDNGNLPVEEAREQLGEVSFLLPFCREIRSAMSCGNLYGKNAGDRVWTGRMREIAAQVVGNAG